MCHLTYINLASSPLFCPLRRRRHRLLFLLKCKEACVKGPRLYIPGVVVCVVWTWCMKLKGVIYLVENVRRYPRKKTRMLTDVMGG